MGQKESKDSVEWIRPSLQNREAGHFINIQVSKKITCFVWHRKGDYFATVSPDGIPKLTSKLFSSANSSTLKRNFTKPIQEV